MRFHCLSAARMLKVGGESRPAPRMRFLVPLLAALFLAVFTLNGPAATRPAPDSFADLTAKLLPSVVQITTSQTLKAPPKGSLPDLPPDSPLNELFKNFLGPRGAQPRHVTSLGSGF